MSLKSKLIIAFCGPLAILVIVGLMSVRTVTLSSKAIERIFRENYDSVAACFKMKGALERLDRIAEFSLWEASEDPLQESRPPLLEFDDSLTFQQGNLTLPGEKELTNRLAALWAAYRSDYEGFLHSTATEEARRDLYRSRLLPHSQEIRDTAQRIIDINLENMISEDGQVRRRAVATTHRMIGLVASGVALSIIFIVVIAPSIVNPITRLTRSVRDIQQGNLDLVVRVHSRDEVGELAAAFNEMTASLRELRRMGRARLLRTQRATQLALDTLSDAVAICSPTGEIELSNHTAQRWFGLKPETVVDAADGYDTIVALLARARQELKPIRPKGYENAIQIFKDGEEHFYLPNALPIFDDERRLIGITLVLADVTGMKRSDAIESGLISTVSHELKTPLTSIRLATHVLLNQKIGPLTPKQTEILAAARDDSDRLSRMIENLLDIGKMESGRSRVELMPVPTEQMLFQVVDTMRPAYADRGIALVIDVVADTPPVLADRMRLESVFTNLLSNALKFTAPGGQVTLSAKRDGSRVCFSVEDTGLGIPAEYLPHVFEKFFRIPGRGQQKDSGLGLAIVKEIIEAHGGTIDVTSEPRKGTRFVFTLRAAAPLEDTA